MKILVYEDNLMWSPRLAKTISSLGHEPIILRRPELQTGDLAIVNLGDARFAPQTLVPALRAQGVHVIGHAGHKELELHELGRQIGCDQLATNRELTYSLGRLLKSAGFEVSVSDSEKVDVE